MISELEALQRIDKPTQKERNRISVLSRKAMPSKVKRVRTRADAPPVWAQIDLIHEKFVGKIEPWTVMKCTTCNKAYHLSDYASCDCGKEESKQRFEKHLGGYKIGTTA